MAVSRTSTTRVLNTVTAGARQTRHLHLTGPASLPIRAVAWDKSVSGIPEAATLRSECRQRGLPANGNKPELMERLTHYSKRQFSTSDSSYDTTFTAETTMSPDQLSIPRISTSAPFSPTNQSRHFNTSRPMKRMGDSSTIDFAHLPIFPHPGLDPGFEDIRVPLLPHISRTDGSKAPMASEISDIDASAVEVHVVSAESTHHGGGPSTMNEASESSQELDFQGMARQLALGLEREGGEEVRKAKGLLKQVWTGFVDDIFGQKQQK